MKIIKLCLLWKAWVYSNTATCSHQKPEFNSHTAALYLTNWIPGNLSWIFPDNTPGYFITTKRDRKYLFCEDCNKLPNIDKCDTMSTNKKPSNPKYIQCCSRIMLYTKTYLSLLLSPVLSILLSQNNINFATNNHLEYFVPYVMIHHKNAVCDMWSPLKEYSL